MEIQNASPQNDSKKRLDYNTRQQIIGFYECCESQTKTADYFGVHQSSISRLLSKFEITNDVSDYVKGGREEKLSVIESEDIKSILQNNKYITSQQIAVQFNVSLPTALKKLYELDLSFSVPKEIPMLNSAHISKHYQYAAQLIGKEVDNLVFFGESYFQLYRNTLGVWHFNDEPNFFQKLQQKSPIVRY
ncbi:hypothetical protein ABPG72_018820 [Tetrahymena utriculariae]